MSLRRLKIAFAISTLAFATLFWLVVAFERDPSLLSFGYLPIAAAFGAAICMATMHRAVSKLPFAPSRSLYQLYSFYTFLPVLISLVWWVRKGPELAAFSFLMTSAAMSLLYLMVLAFKRSKLAGATVR